MTGIRAAIWVSVILLVAATTTPAGAYSDAGDRKFPASLILPQIAPGDEFYVDYSYLPLSGGHFGASTDNNSLNIVYAKTITDNLGIFVEESYTRLGRVGTGNAYGWQNFEAELKYLAYTNAQHEFLLSLGLDREFGGTGAGRVGASFSSATAPRVYFGKGLGDLDIGYLRPLAITGFGGVSLADMAPRPNLVTTGFSVEYSIPYLESKVESFDLPDLIRGLTPMTEVLFTSPAGRSYGARTTALVAPGISYAGEGYEFAVEAMVPTTRATGKGVGVIAQMHFSLDFLVPGMMGKPLFGAVNP
jgi:hypothetical protein